MAEMKKLVIFDLDGTLLNTIDDLAASGNAVLAAHGWPTHPVDAYKHFVGDGVRKLVERMCPPEVAGDGPLFEVVLEEQKTWYSAHSEDQTRPYEGIQALLDELARREIRVAVLSNKPHEVTSVLVPNYFGDRFTVILGQRRGYPRKPDKRLVREALELAGITAGDCAYVGDSGVDMRTAKNGGVYAIGAAWGFRGERELRDSGADAIAVCPLDVLKFL